MGGGASYCFTESDGFSIYLIFSPSRHRKTISNKGAPVPGHETRLGRILSNLQFLHL